MNPGGFGTLLPSGSGVWPGVAALSMAALLAVSARAALAQSAPPPSPASYTTVQADSGGVTFQRSCASCHAADLSGASGPPLAGAPFAYNWDGKFASSLVSYIERNEPRPNGGSLDDATVARLIAYILAMNGVEAGGEPFTTARRTVLVLSGARMR
jgi:mono/diheme cytochrome c family protein